MATIDTLQAIPTEIVLQERVTTTEFKVIEVQESIRQRFVRAEIELGPFTEVTGPGGQTYTQGTSRRGVDVWNGDEYDTIRDTWNNNDLILAIKSKL
jgi:hypothetical protein